MNNEYGKLVAEFDTKLTGVLLQRILRWPVLAPLVVLVGIVYMWVKDERADEAAVWRILAIAGAALLIILYNLLAKKMYNAKIYERGAVLTNKMNKKAESLSFDDVMNVRDIEWTHRYGFIPFLKTREFEIHVKNRKRCISMNGRCMGNIKGFGAAFAGAFNTYKKSQS